LSISCNGAHSALISSENQLYTWGRNSLGRLGHSDIDLLGNSAKYALKSQQKEGQKVDVPRAGDVLVPTLVEALKNEQVIQVSAFPFALLAESDDGAHHRWSVERFTRLSCVQMAKL
jgi:alpha-tubulin suppressor-like RCC1 family protein